MIANADYHNDHNDDNCAPHDPVQSLEIGHHHGSLQGNDATGFEIRKRLQVVLILTGILMIVELVAGLCSHSLALVADAAHMLSDIASQILALFAIWVAAKPPTADKSYGYHRTEILAGLINGVVLVVLALYIILEAITRLTNPPVVQGTLMLTVAALGLIVNLVSLKILSNAHDISINVKTAYLELFGDALASGGVLATAILIAFTNWYLADPLISIVVGTLILPRTWLLLCECTNILMEGTPKHINIDQLRSVLLKVDGVIDVHDMHVWTISSGLDAMSGHLCVSNRIPSDNVLQEVTRIAQKEFGIQHTTFQVETVNPPEHPSLSA